MRLATIVCRFVRTNSEARWLRSALEITFGGFMKIRTWSPAVCVLWTATGLLWSVPAQAQTTTASIHGAVTDPSNAVLPGATVTVVNASTGISKTQKTDNKGYF